jgi:hypothetical protein
MRSALLSIKRVITRTARVCRGKRKTCETARCCQCLKKYLARARREIYRTARCSACAFPVSAVASCASYAASCCALRMQQRDGGVIQAWRQRTALRPERARSANASRTPMRRQTSPSPDPLLGTPTRKGHRMPAEPLTLINACSWLARHGIVTGRAAQAGRPRQSH